MAESAHSRIILITRFTDMVRLRVTLCTEVFLALITPDSVVGHVDSCLLGYEVSLIVLLPLDNFSRNELHDISTLTAHEVRVGLYNLHGLVFLDDFLLFLVQILFSLELGNVLMTFRALHLFVF